MAYTKTTWSDGENKYDIKTQDDVPIEEGVKIVYVGSGGTALSAANFNGLETQYDEVKTELALDGGDISVHMGNITSARPWRLIQSFTHTNTGTLLDFDTGTMTQYDIYRIIGLVGGDGSANTREVLCQVNNLSVAYYRYVHLLAATLTNTTGQTQWRLLEIDCRETGVFDFLIRGASPGSGTSRRPVLMGYGRSRLDRTGTLAGSYDADVESINRIRVYGSNTQLVGRMQVFGRNLS